MFSQLLAAGTVIVSKTQMFSEQTAGETVEKINALMEQMGSGRRFGEDVCRKKWDDFTDEDFEEFQRSGYQIPAVCCLPICPSLLGLYIGSRIFRR